MSGKDYGKLAETFKNNVRKIFKEFWSKLDCFVFLLKILEAVDQPNCQRLDRPDLCPREYFDLMKSCWEDDPKDRPTFSEIFLKQPKVSLFTLSKIFKNDLTVI